MLKKLLFTCVVGVATSITISCSKHSNELVLDLDYLDALTKKEFGRNKLPVIVTNNLCLVYKFNKLMPLINHRDSIRVYVDGQFYYGVYKGEKISLKNKFKIENKYLNLQGAKGCKWDYMWGKFFTSATTSTSFMLSNGNEYKADPLIKLSNYKNGILIDEYTEKSMSGKHIVQGQYMQIDSIYRDTIRTFDPETYEEKMQVIDQTKKGVRCGKWIFKNIKGELIKIEVKRECK